MRLILNIYVQYTIPPAHHLYKNLSFSSSRVLVPVEPAPGCHKMSATLQAGHAFKSVFSKHRVKFPEKEVKYLRYF